LVGTYGQSPQEYIFNQLNSFIGWKCTNSSGNTYRYKCCQEKNGCPCELKITVLKDDSEDFANFEIKVEKTEEEHSNHKNEEITQFIKKRKMWGKNPFYSFFLRLLRPSPYFKTYY